MNTVVYFGDNDTSIARYAKSRDTRASLLDRTNYETFLTHNNGGVFYTSLADLPKNLEVIYAILLKANLIVYSPPLVWSDNRSSDPLNIGNSIQGLTEYLLLSVSHLVEVKNIELCYEFSFENVLHDKRKSLDPQLWVVGCSVSHGVGVAANERYGELLRQQLNLECSFLTEQGSCIEWAADQILQSDLHKDDVVCWGLTAYTRIHYYHNNKLHHVFPTFYSMNKGFNKILPLEYINNTNRLYKITQAIKSVINYCNKLQVKLVMFNAVNDSQLIRLLKKEKNFYQFLYPFNKYHHTYNSHGLHIYYDYSHDKEHPGPLTHKKISNFLANIITQL